MNRRLSRIRNRSATKPNDNCAYKSKVLFSTGLCSQESRLKKTPSTFTRNCRFAVPGLLGSPKLFNDHYAMPIDKFKDSARAKELQRKINPFLLRRTKKQVAHELPEKTEMVVYCEMGAEQRKVYDTYKAEFQRFLAGMDEADYATGNMHILA